MGTNNGFSIAERAMLVSQNISIWPATRTDKQAARDLETMKNAKAGTTRVSKDLFDKGLKEYKAFTEIESVARSEYGRVTLPWETGRNLLPTTLYFDFSRKMAELEQKFRAAVPAFLAIYPSLESRSRAEMGGLHNSDDWPSAEALLRKFRFRVRYDSLPSTSNDFRWNLGAEQEELIRKAAEADFAERMTGTLTDLIARLRYVLADEKNGFIPRVAAYSVNDKGKTVKTFRDSAVENVRETVAIVRRLNFTNNGAIEEMCKAIEGSVLGFSADQLRDDYITRGQTVDKAKQIASTLNVLEDLFNQQAGE